MPSLLTHPCSITPAEPATPACLSSRCCADAPLLCHVQAFFAQIYSEAQDSKPARGHEALGQLHELKKLQRHYTMNIDGLAEDVGMDTWHWEFNPEGITVEMHGCIRCVMTLRPQARAVHLVHPQDLLIRQQQPPLCSVPWAPRNNQNIHHGMRLPEDPHPHLPKNHVLTHSVAACCRDTVCPSCNAVQPLNRTIINVMKAKKPVQCENCKSGEMRFKVSSDREACVGLIMCVYCSGRAVRASVAPGLTGIWRSLLAAEKLCQMHNDPLCATLMP